MSKIDSSPSSHTPPNQAPQDIEEKEDRYSLEKCPPSLFDTVWGYTLYMTEGRIFDHNSFIRQHLKSGYSWLFADSSQILQKLQMLFCKTFPYTPANPPSFLQGPTLGYYKPIVTHSEIIHNNPALCLQKVGLTYVLPALLGSTLGWLNQKYQIIPPSILKLMTVTSMFLNLYHIRPNAYNYLDSDPGYFSTFVVSEALSAALNGFLLTHIVMQIKKDYINPPVHSKQSLKKRLDKYIIGQDRAKEKIIDAINLHQLTQGTDFFKPARILLTGPTGSGKTAMVKALSKTLKIPMITVDGASLTPEGYVGPSVSDIYKSMIIKTAYNPWKGDKCIVFIDEIDKVCKSAGGSASGDATWIRRVQDQLLKVIEGVKFPEIFPFLNTENIIFVLGGSFDGLQRADEQGELTTDQLVEFGVSRELVGRLSTIAQVEPMNKEELRRVLHNERGLCSIPEWKKLFKLYGVDLEIEDEVIESILDFAINEETGVRGLDAVLKQFLNQKLREVQDVTATYTFTSKSGVTYDHLNFADYNRLLESHRTNQTSSSDDSPTPPKENTTLTLTLEDWKKTELYARFEYDQRIPSYDEIYEALDRYVIGQEKAKKVVTESVYMQQLNIKRDLKLQKGNLLMVGPSGSGKTFMMETLGRELDIPVAVHDASKLTPEGFVGGKVEDVILKLLEKTNGDVKAAQKGIIVLDEMDKVFENNKPGAHSRSGQMPARAILNQLLRVIQGDSITVKYKGKIKTVDTTNIQFVLAGSFSGCPNIQEQEHPDERALLDAGITPEFLGRLGGVTKLDPIGQRELRECLGHLNEGGLLGHWAQVFKQMGVRLRAEPQVIEEWIRFSDRSQTGIRGLQNLVRDQLHPFIAQAQQLSLDSEKEATLTLTYQDWQNSPPYQQIQSLAQYPSAQSLRDSLDAYMIGQESAKAAVCEAVYVQQLNIARDLNLPKGNILMIGPSGSGKTYMMEILNREHQIALGALDASKLTSQGFVGPDPEDVLIDLLDSCNGDIRAAEKGIIFLDEMDKVIYESARDGYGNLNELRGTSVLNQLLKMIQGDRITLDYHGQEITLDTTHIQFVFAGAFSKSPYLYEKETLEESDLLSVGFTPEFLGRVGTVTRLNPVTTRELEQYLISEAGIIPKWQEAFAEIGAKLDILPETLQEWTERCLGNQTGFRGIQNLVRDELTQKLVEAASQDRVEGAPLVVTV